MPVYMAKAREPFDAGGFGLFYGNPCDGLSPEPRIYFQPLDLRPGPGAPPDRARGRASCSSGSGLPSALACARVALALYEQFVGLDSRAKRIGLVGFLWGGGLLAVGGMTRGA